MPVLQATTQVLRTPEILVSNWIEPTNKMFLSRFEWFSLQIYLQQPQSLKRTFVLSVEGIIVGNHAYARLNSTKKKKNTRQRAELGDLKNFPNPAIDDVPYEIPSTYGYNTSKCKILEPGLHVGSATYDHLPRYLYYYYLSILKQ